MGFLVEFFCLTSGAGSESEDEDLGVGSDCQMGKKLVVKRRRHVSV